jgi:S1-C subfamily serine protease
MTLPAFAFETRAAVAGAFMMVLWSPLLPAASTLESMNSEVAALYEKSKDAIVRVHAKSAPSPDPWQLRPPHRVGTGFFVDEDGRLLTSGSLVDETDTCWVDWRGQRRNARVIGRDPNTNLAVLQLDSEPDGRPVAPTPKLEWGDSSELRVGSLVVAIGYPYDLPSAPVVGFVGGLDSRCGARMFPVSFVRANCRLLPGQGGGPLLNARGEVVGIAVASHAEDQCYALPINAAKRVCADIIEHGRVQYGWVGLGVMEQPVTNESGQIQWRVFVQQVNSNTPAATAGFQARDVIVRICTNDIHRSADVLNTMFYQRCGTRLKMTVLRESQTQEVTVAVGERPPPEPSVPKMILVPPIQLTGPMPRIVPVSDTK